MRQQIEIPVVSLGEKFPILLRQIVQDKELHTKWLNTLSYMEHIGATLIAQTQYGSEMTYTLLKHTAEEARHAFYLKRLCLKLDADACPTYASQYLLAPLASKQYLHRLNAAVFRLLRDAGYEGKALSLLSYLLVTYAIEMRADVLYPAYQQHLVHYPVKISVQGIINEEEGHLEEMEAMLVNFSGVEGYKQQSLRLEQNAWENWVAELSLSLSHI